MRLEQTKRILTRAAQYDDRDGGVIAYAAWSDDVDPVDRLTAAPETGLLLDVDTWADMDAPEEITVTIQAGDRINGPEGDGNVYPETVRRIDSGIAAGG